MSIMIIIDHLRTAAACPASHFGLTPQVKGALQLLSKLHMQNRVAQVPERISVSGSDGDRQRFIQDLPMKP